MYQIGKTQVRRVGKDKLELKIGTEKAEVFTEDLAALVASELPEDRATELLQAVEEKFIQKGKARVIVTAKKDIKKGEPVCFILDISKYAGGVRTTPSGLLY